MGKSPSIPAIPKGIDPDLLRILSSIKQKIESIDANSSGQSVSQSTKLSATALGIPVEFTNTNPPPEPTGLSVQAGKLLSAKISFDLPDYSGHSHAEVWKAYSNDKTLAKCVGSTAGTSFLDLDLSEIEAFFWIRFVSLSGTKGAFSSVPSSVQFSLDKAFINQEVQLSIDDLNSKILQINQSILETNQRIDLLSELVSTLIQPITNSGTGGTP